MLKTFLGKISTLIETLNNNNEKNIIWIISILFQQNTNYPNKTKLSQQRVSLHYADLRALKKLPYPKFSCKCSHLQDLVEVKVKKNSKWKPCCYKSCQWRPLLVLLQFRLCKQRFGAFFSKSWRLQKCGDTHLRQHRDFRIQCVNAQATLQVCNYTSLKSPGLC